MIETTGDVTQVRLMVLIDISDLEIGRQSIVILFFSIIAIG